MYRTGHYGAALLLYAPLGFVLLGVAPAMAFVGGAAVLFLATLPDVDHRLPLVSHRGVTHTLPFLAAVAGALAAAGWYLGLARDAATAAELAAFGAAVGVVGVGSHLLADMLTPAGVPLLWPLSGRSYSWRVARASNVVANWTLLALGVFATGVVLLLAGRL